MAGCSVVLLAIIMLPLTIACAIALVALKFVTSPAFIFLVASGIFGIAAIVDAALILWHRRGDGPKEPLSVGTFRRPIILLVIAAVLFVVMAILAGSMIMSWYTEVSQYSS